MSRIDGDLACLDAPLRGAILQRPGTGKIQAHLEAARMKTPRPVHVRVDPEIVPFDADSAVKETAVQRPPFSADA